MTDQDRPAFAALLTDALAFYGRNASDFALDVWWQACQPYTVGQVSRALSLHAMDAQRGRFAPMPADMIAQLEGQAAHDGRPGSNEAWGMALRACDEAATVVWTTEMAQAWQACKPVFALGDDVGARMAFREAYERLVQQARAARIPVQWLASLGWDAAQRDDVLREAALAGRIPMSALSSLSAPATDVPLLTDANGTPEPGGIPPHIREQLRALRERLTARAPCGPSRDQRAKAETARRKALAQAALQRYTAPGGSNGGNNRAQV
jgi:hypothetical protein